MCSLSADQNRTRDCTSRWTWFINAPQRQGKTDAAQATLCAESIAMVIHRTPPSAEAFRQALRRWLRLPPLPNPDPPMDKPLDTQHNNPQRGTPAANLKLSERTT